MTINQIETKQAGYQAHCTSHDVRGPMRLITTTNNGTGAEAYELASKDISSLRCVALFDATHPHECGDIVVEPLTQEPTKTN
jgi:hypothetical protein